MHTHTNASAPSGPSPGRARVKLALFWAVIGGLAAFAALPYATALAPPPEDVPLMVLYIAQPLQTAAIIFFGGWLALRLGENLGLDSPIARAYVTGETLPALPVSRVIVALGAGIATGLAIMWGDRALFMARMPEPKTALFEDGVPLWKGLLGSLYGGIGEELLTRLVFMTIVAWLLWRFVAGRRVPVVPGVYWSAMVLAGLVFGLGHLPAVSGVWDLTPVVITRTILLNFVPALVFGRLYWRWGLEYAMVAHFMSDIVLRTLGV